MPGQILVVTKRRAGKSASASGDKHSVPTPRLTAENAGKSSSASGDKHSLPNPRLTATNAGKSSSASGDKHSLPNPRLTATNAGKSPSASGGKRSVRKRPAASSDIPADIGKNQGQPQGYLTSIWSHGLRIRVHSSKRHDLTLACKEKWRGCASEGWTRAGWKKEVQAIKANMDLGVLEHGGSRPRCATSQQKSASGDDTDTDTGKRSRGSAAGDTDTRKRSRQLASGDIDTDKKPRELASGDIDTDKKPRELASGNTDTDRRSSKLADGDTEKRSRESELAAGNTVTGPMVVRHELGYRLLGPCAGSGSFGSVYPIMWKGGANDVGELAMVKHIKIGRPHVGMSIQEAREAEITSSLTHDNVVHMLQAIQTPFAIDLIFEHCLCDLRHALKTSMKLASQQILRHICCGLAYVHGEGVMHRDLKPSNILLQTRPGDALVAKITDFGLARRVPKHDAGAGRVHDDGTAGHWQHNDGTAGHWQHTHALTTQVTTLWYRAPEVLLASREYGTGVDMWAVGCIAVEVLTKSVAFPGTSENHMLLKIFSFAGTRRSDTWPTLLKLPQFRTFIQSNKMQPKGVPWPSLTADARTFVVAALEPCPSERQTAQTALKDNFLLATGSDVPDMSRPLT